MKHHAKHPHSGFNLIEVLVAMAIFAIGFAMIAGIVPAGHLLNRRTEDDVLAIIAAKNVVAVIEAKKIFTPAWEHTYTHDQINEGAYPAGTFSAPGTPQDLQASARGGEAKSLEGSLFDIRNGANVNIAAGPIDWRPNDGDNIPDWEDRLATNHAWAVGSRIPFPGDSPVDGPSGVQCRGWLYLPQSFRDAYDTNGDGNPGNGAGEQFNLNDCTSMPLGSIHAFHNRIGYSDIFPSEDVTYPTYITTLGNRDYLSSIMVADLNANASNRRWVAAVAVLRRHSGDTWPERALPRTGDSGVRLVTPNNPSLLVSIEGNNHPNTGWPVQWGYWNSYCVSGNDTDPNIPGMYNLPMIVYDWANNLIEVAYPPCWTPGAYTPTVDAAVDRRMKAGDKFIAREGGTVFTVLSTRDVGANLSVQIVEVYPTLRTTLLGPNSDPNWRLREGYFAPRPALGGASPLIRVELLSATRGFTTNTNH